MSVSYFRPIFENLFEGSKVFHILPNAKRSEQAQMEAKAKVSQVKFPSLFFHPHAAAAARGS